MTVRLGLPDTLPSEPRITVVGVGGGGGNAVDNMIADGLAGVEFVCCNTDAQALSACLAERRVQLGARVTHGLGAGARPEVGRAAAEESLDEILDQLSGSHMVFVAAGMGGGTGTGAAPVVARAAREQGILTVGVVTKPFMFEGAHRMRLAEAGVAELRGHVDTLIVIPNQGLFRLANERTTFHDAFRMADRVLHMGVRGVTDLMVVPGLINLDFADIRAVMSGTGEAMMGTGEGEGPRRALDAAEAAVSNPLLDDVSLRGARAVLINITGGPDMTLFEVDAVATRVREEVDPDANIIFGSALDEAIGGRMRVSVVATGIAATPAPPSLGEARGEPRPEPSSPPRAAADPPLAARLRVAEPVSEESPAEARATAPPQPRGTFLDRLRGRSPASSGTDARPEGGEASAPAVEADGDDRATPEELGDIPGFLRRR